MRLRSTVTSDRSCGVFTPLPNGIKEGRNFKPQSYGLQENCLPNGRSFPSDNLCVVVFWFSLAHPRVETWALSLEACRAAGSRP